MAYSSYRSEVKNIQSFLQMKSLAPPPGQASPNLDAMEMNAESFVSPRYTKKYKTKQVCLWAMYNTLDFAYKHADYVRPLSLNSFSNFVSVTFLVVTVWSWQHVSWRPTRTLHICLSWTPRCALSRRGSPCQSLASSITLSGTVHTCRCSSHKTVGLVNVKLALKKLQVLQL